MNVYVVAFKGNRRGFYIDHHNLEINTGTYLVVETERGEDYGIVERKSSDDEFNPEDEIPKVLRLGIESDYDRLIFNRNKEEETFFECLKFIEKHRLKMRP